MYIDVAQWMTLRNLVPGTRLSLLIALWILVCRNTYLLLTESEVCTVSYGPSFFHCLMTQARSARAIKK
jgi:hypothetical protein